MCGMFDHFLPAAFSHIFRHSERVFADPVVFLRSFSSVQVIVQILKFRDKLVKQKFGVERSGARFGVKLDGKNRFFSVGDALDRAVVAVFPDDFEIGRTGGRVDFKTVILSGDDSFF